MNERLDIWQEQLPYNIWLVGVRGRLDQSLTPQLDSTLGRLLDNGRYRLVVSLKEVTYINSGGLRCLVSAWRRARGKNGDVVLFGLNDRILEIFTMVGFDKVFHIYKTSIEAQAALRQTVEK
ncbi:MAG: STAS domain-containing protein [Chloroflexota bacterium]